MLRWLVPALAAALLTLPGAGRAAEARPYVGLEAGFRTGDFGTSVRSDLYSAYLNAGLVGDDWDLGATAAFHGLRTEGADTEAGPGDIVGRAGHVLMPTTDTGLSLYGTAAVKLPTADEDDALGTGETDLGGFLSLRQRFSRFQAELYGGYTVVGDPPGVDYNNTVTFGGELFAPMGSGWGYLGLEGRTALTDGSDDPLEVFVGGFAPVDFDLTVTGEAFLGLSDGSPDMGVRAGFVQWF